MKNTERESHATMEKDERMSDETLKKMKESQVKLKMIKKSYMKL